MATAAERALPQHEEEGETSEFSTVLEEVEGEVGIAN